VLNNANIVEAATMDAVAELTALEDLLSGATIDSEKLSKARAYLGYARHAFTVVETSLYYTDPNSEAELTALPPKLITTLPGLKQPGFDALEDMLASRATGETTFSDADIRSAAKSLRQDLEILSAAWSAGALDNFRNGTFLPDPNATGRICQGMATTADILVLSSLEADPVHVLDRLWGMKFLLEGTYEGINGTKIRGGSILDLVSEKDAALVKSMRTNLNSIIKEYESTATPSADTSSAIERLHEEVLSAARALGYEITPVSP
jgi:hypothetical protein